VINDIGSVATRLKYGGIFFNDHFTTNLLLNLLVKEFLKEFLKSIYTFDDIISH